VALKIRPMTRRDKPTVLSILEATAEFDETDKVIAKELIDSYLTDGTESGYHILVSETNSKVSGYICYGPTPLTEGTWDVYWIVVAKESQSGGIGTALLTTAESHIKKTKGRMVLIETESSESYEKTRQFYLRRGYKMVCQIADFYNVGRGKLVYQKLLESE